MTLFPLYLSLLVVHIFSTKLDTRKPTNILIHSTAVDQYAHLNKVPASLVPTLRRSKFSLSRYTDIIRILLLLSGDIQPNPGPTQSNPGPTQSHITLCTLNIRSLTNPKHAHSLHEIAHSQLDSLFLKHTLHSTTDVIALTETWVSSSTTTSQLIDATPSGFTLISFPRISKSTNSSSNLGGGTAFLIRDHIQITSTSSTQFSSFESSSVTLKLPYTKLTIFNVYRPPLSSKYSTPFGKFLDEFTTFLGSAATTPHEFLITGDFNIHLDKNNDPNSTQFTHLLAQANLTQHISFPTHIFGHTLDLLITLSSSTLSPHSVVSPYSPSDHFPIFTILNVCPPPPPPRGTYSFRRLNKINITTFCENIKSSDLITKPPNTLQSLIDKYNSVLSDLLDMHAPLITRPLSSHGNKPWYNSFIHAFKSFRRRLERTYTRTHSTIDLKNLRSATNRYHNLLISAKKNYYSNLIASNRSNPRKLWNTVNGLFHRNSTKPLPQSISQLAESFANFFSEKISNIRIKLKSTMTDQTISPHYPSPPEAPSNFSCFTPATEEEVSKLLQSFPNKQCSLDPIPTSLLKQCSSLLLPTITKIINLSLLTGTFPSSFKNSLVTPLLKKPNLNREDLNNYRPISNLSVLSKLTEKIVLSRLTDHLSKNSLYNTHQSAYTKHHSTETVLAYIYDKLLTAIGFQQVTGLCLLDLSAAFDTIDHKILMKRLSLWFGISSVAYRWFQSYLQFRSFQVSCLNQTSLPSDLCYGVPQGSVLGPVLFSLYTTPLSSLINSLNLNHQLYADDTQLFLSFTPSSFKTSVAKLESAFSLISSWMSANLLALNPSKTEFLLIGLPQQLKKIENPTLTLAPDTMIAPVLTAKNLGIIFDSSLNFEAHISQLSKTCYAHIRDLRRLRPYLDIKTASTIATSIVHSKLDYCNSLFHNLPKTSICKLQSIQNALARAVTKSPKFCHITPLLKSLHWLKIVERIQYKIISMTFNSLHSSKPVYLRNLIIPQHPRSTRSSSHVTLLRPMNQSSLKICNRAFSYAAPELWNSIPAALRCLNHGQTTNSQSQLPSPLATSPQVFRSKLKAFLFRKSFPP